MSQTSYKREFPADLARAGEVRHFISWAAAVAGLRGGSLSDLAIAAEAVLTDIFLSNEVDVLEVESEVTDKTVKITIRHPTLRRRRMAGLEGIMEQFLDGHEFSPTKAILVKSLS